MSVKAYLTANTIQGYTARQERLNGVDYLVAPATILVEGVHRGSAGAIFYPANELSAFVGAWDGRPVTLGHPEIDGEPVGASTPDALEQFSLGMLMGTVYDPEQSRLRAEVWVDMARARRLAPEVLEAMQKGEPVEVSTGLWFEAQGGSGMWGNEEFETTATRFRPDHLALLPGLVGACSISDGCGLRANKEEKGGGKGVVNVRASARRPSFDGTESTAWSAPSWAGIISGYNSATGSSVEASVSTADAPQALKNWAARLSLLGDERADNLRDLVFFPVVNPSNRNLSERALRAVIGGRGSQAQIPAAARDSAQTLARRLLNSEFDAGLEVGNMKFDERGFFSHLRDFFRNEQEPKEAVVARMLESVATNQPGMVSTVKALQTQLDAMDRETPNGFLVHWLEEAFDDGTFIMRQSGPEGEKFFRGTFEATDDEVVAGNDFTEVREKKEFIEVSNEGDGGSEEGKITDKEEGNVSNATDAKKTLVDNLIACGRTAFSENHREGLMAMDEPALEALKAKDEQPAPQPAGNEAPVAPKTLEEVVANAPEEFRTQLQDGIEVSNKRKEEAIKNIMEAPGNKFTEDELNAKNLKEVEAIESLIKVNEEQEGTEQENEGGMGNGTAQPTGNFSGKAPAHTDAPAGNEQEAPLGRPIGY
jgi:hypothetical protein